ncbi:MAG: metallophosphoesterase family protein [Deltaproteobacteria bacterium]|nr:metallophosphoesterase family protein [Deltaproteobacteria bacterium]
MDPIERLGLIGDVHAEDGLLAAALAFLQRRELDLILCTGDLADGPGSVKRCAELLQQAHVVTVAGNHDRWLLTGRMRQLPEATARGRLDRTTRRYLSELPKTVELETIHGKALLCHGLGEDDMARLHPDDYGYAIEQNWELQELLRDRRYHFVLNGHSHHRMVRRFDHLTVINAGTLKRDHDPGFLMVDFASGEATLLDLGPDGQVTFALRTALDGAPTPLDG